MAWTASAACNNRFYRTKYVVKGMRPHAKNLVVYLLIYRNNTAILARHSVAAQYVNTPAAPAPSPQFSSHTAELNPIIRTLTSFVVSRSSLGLAQARESIPLWRYILSLTHHTLTDVNMRSILMMTDEEQHYYALCSTRRLVRQFGYI